MEWILVEPAYKNGCEIMLSVEPLNHVVRAHEPLKKLQILKSIIVAIKFVFL